MGLGVPTTPQHHPRFLLVLVHGTMEHSGCVFGSFCVQPCTVQPARANSLARGWAEQLLGMPRNVSAVRAPEKKPFAISGEALCVSDARLLRAQQQWRRARALHGQGESCEKCSPSLLRCLEAA